LQDLHRGNYNIASATLPKGYAQMPQKIRQLKASLQKAGFVMLKKRGKGSHTLWEHPLIRHAIILSGKDGDDADRYQEKDVRNALAELKQAQQPEDES
jgi:predicted RNA binding protein YcfA (HicA-like mRNA interferase family)